MAAWGFLRRNFQFPESSAQILHDLLKGFHVAIAVIQADPQSFHGNSHLIGRLRHVRQKRADGSKCLGRFDSGVCHQADGDRHVFCAIAHGPGDRSHVFKRFSHHLHIGVRITGGRRHDVCEVPRVFGRQTESGQRIGHNIRGRCQIGPGRCRKI